MAELQRHILDHVARVIGHPAPPVT
jgi:hypothetical protein